MSDGVAREYDQEQNSGRLACEGITKLSVNCATVIQERPIKERTTHFINKKSVNNLICSHILHIDTCIGEWLNGSIDHIY